MNITLENTYDYVCELRADADLTSVPLHSETVTRDIVELIDESYVRGVLSEKLPPAADSFTIQVEPCWREEPVVEKLTVRLTAAVNGSRVTYTQSFAAGRWVRSSQLAALRLREEGTLEKDQIAHRVLIGLKRKRPVELDIPPLQSPPIADQLLEDFGVRKLGQGNLVPDRPVLVNERLAADAVRRCEEAGTSETGGAVLGKILRLDKPLPGTETRIVTLLSTTVEDPRHVGVPLKFTFSPEGLAEAAGIGDLRGFGESIQTVFHTHGWSQRCQNPNCNENPNCPLAECNPSLADYTVLESLFSSKATLLPISGRKYGETVSHPVLQIHAWRGGEMRPIRWQEYCD